MSEFRPLLLASSDIDDYPNAFGYSTVALDTAVRKKLEEGTSRHGVFEAAELLLRESAVAIEFIDIDEVGKPILEGEDLLYKNSNMLLAFNDHGGGSESGYKVLMNRVVGEKPPEQHVLFSPPLHNGRASNTVFHRSSFASITAEHVGDVQDLVPNPLKTGAAARSFGRDDYHFYLLGTTAIPEQLSCVLEKVGFSFDPEPYSEATACQLRDYERDAKQRLSYKDYMLWPQQQFSANIAVIRIAEEAA